MYEERDEKGQKKACYMCIHLGEFNKRSGHAYCNILKTDVDIYYYCPGFEEKN
jgi:hypothetical protein